LKIYPYALAIPVFNTAVWCIYNGSSAYTALGVINLFLGLSYSLLQGLHEIDLDFEQHDMLNRRNCLSIFVTFIDPLVSCLFTGIG
jgi:hypothetical protein